MDLKLGDKILARLCGLPCYGWVVGTLCQTGEYFSGWKMEPDYTKGLESICGSPWYVYPDFSPIPPNCSSEQLEALRSILANNATQDGR